MSAAQLEIVLVDDGNNEPDYSALSGVAAENRNMHRDSIGIPTPGSNSTEKANPAKREDKESSGHKSDDRENLKTAKQGGNALLQVLGVDQQFSQFKELFGKSTEIVKGFQAVGKLIASQVVNLAANGQPKQPGTKEPESNDLPDTRAMELGVPERVHASEGHSEIRATRDPQPIPDIENMESPDAPYIVQAIDRLADMWKPSVLAEEFAKAVRDELGRENDRDSSQASQGQSSTGRQESPSVQSEPPKPVEKSGEIGVPEAKPTQGPTVQNDFSQVDANLNRTGPDANQINIENRDERKSTNSHHVSNQITNSQRTWQYGNRASRDVKEVLQVRQSPFSGVASESASGSASIAEGMSSVESAAGAGMSVAQAGAAAEGVAAGAGAAGSAGAAGASAAGAAGSAAGGAVGGLGGAAAGAAAALGPVAVALAAVGAAAIGAVVGTKMVLGAFKQVADQVEQFSAPVAKVRAQNEVQTQRNLIGRAEQIGPQLAKIEAARSRMDDATQKLWTEILNLLVKFEPQIQVAADSVTALVSLGSVIVASLESVGAKLTPDGGADDAIAQAKFDKAFAEFGKRVADIFVDNNAAVNNGMDPFLAELFKIDPNGQGGRLKKPLAKGGF